MTTVLDLNAWHFLAPVLYQSCKVLVHLVLVPVSIMTAFHDRAVLMRASLDFGQELWTYVTNSDFMKAGSTHG